MNYKSLYRYKERSWGDPAAKQQNDSRDCGDDLLPVGPPVYRASIFAFASRNWYGSL